MAMDEFEVVADVGMAELPDGMVADALAVQAVDDVQAVPEGDGVDVRLLSLLRPLQAGVLQTTIMSLGGGNPVVLHRRRLALFVAVHRPRLRLAVYNHSLGLRRWPFLSILMPPRYRPRSSFIHPRFSRRLAPLSRSRRG